MAKSVVCNTEGKETIGKLFMDSTDLKCNDIRADHIQWFTEYSNTARNFLCMCYTKRFEVSLALQRDAIIATIRLRIFMQIHIF